MSERILTVCFQPPVWVWALWDLPYREIHRSEGNFMPTNLQAGLTPLWSLLEGRIVLKWHDSENSGTWRSVSHTRWRLFKTGTQRGVLSGLSRERNLRSKIWWFTEFCNSHYVSHFAAFFIVAGTKISVVNSCSGFVFLNPPRCT